MGGEGESTKCKTYTVDDAFEVGRIESKNVKVILFRLVGEGGLKKTHGGGFDGNGGW